MLIVDGAPIHATVHGGRLHNGQGRRPLVPCTAENGNPLRNARYVMGAADPTLGRAAVNPGPGSRGEVGRTSVVKNWPLIATVTLRAV
jgi:hypothetical protein